MAAQKPSIPKGTRDFGPTEVQRRRYIISTIEGVFKKYGFMPIETPTMENLSTLEGKYGEEGDKLLFRILNSGDYLKELKEKHGNSLPTDLRSASATSFISEKGLRYDLTVPFARFVVMNRNDIMFPFKRYQIQPVWRADRPQKGRYREFWQCDADVVGSDSLLNELDLVQIYDEAFRKLGVEQYKLRINNRKILAGIAEVVKGAGYLVQVSTAIDKQDKIGRDGVARELEGQGFTTEEIDALFDIMTLEGNNQEVLSALREKLQASAEGLKGIDELEFVLGCVNATEQAAKQKINLRVDLSLARGLSYYTGCIFEVVSLEGSLSSSIGGGGRYDNLTGIFGLPNVSGVGISFGLDRIYDVMEELRLFPPDLKSTTTRVLICSFDLASQQYALPVVKQFRDAGIAAEVYPDPKKLGKQLDYANALQIPYACIIGETEMQSGKLQLKDLASGEQQMLTVTEIIQKLSAG